MEKYRTADVFVAGGMPKLTYVPRAERKLEERLRSAKENLCKLVAVTGATKSGKTVLVSTVFPRTDAVWVDGGTVKAEDDLWNCILEGLDGFTEIASSERQEESTGFQGELEAEIKLPLWASAKGNVSGNRSTSRGREQSRRLSLSPRAAAISQLRLSKRPLIIDDFHYLERDFQGNIIRALKPLIFEGLPVVLIAIPHRRYDAVKVERELTGRLEAINIPAWEVSELLEIATEGFPLLHVEVPASTTERLAREAYGSPHLMQEFCREFAKCNGIDETTMKESQVSVINDDLFRSVAEGTGKVIFDKLAKGPRPRADRIQRKLKNGDKGDIYKVILYALAKLGPGLETIEYDRLRSAIREILADKLPQANEVSRVLEKMGEIAQNDEASTPVIDWEKQEQKLHITDPFFAFYLKWGIPIAQPTAQPGVPRVSRES
ncbi:MAG: hypothetical protein NTZ17_08665 [Phycisphaerae bacterium]|nr:hypothetical protein [Phycisphaerae bacterium]